MPWHEASLGSASRAPFGKIHHGSLCDDGYRGPAIRGQPGTERGTSSHRRENTRRDSPASAFSGRSRVGVSLARSTLLDAFGRRGAAHSTGNIAWLTFGRRALCAG